MHLTFENQQINLLISLLSHNDDYQVKLPDYTDIWQTAIQTANLCI